MHYIIHVCLFNFEPTSTTSNIATGHLYLCHTEISLLFAFFFLGNFRATPNVPQLFYIPSYISLSADL